MLAVAGELNFQTGGPGVMPPLSPELRKTLLNNQWKVTADVSQHRRRSIYIFARRNLRYPVFEAFDRPDANASCARRNESTTANQSLLMLNSATSLEMARHLAGAALIDVGGDVAKAISVVFQRALGRLPTQSENASLAAFLEDHANALRSENRDPDRLAAPLPMPDDCDVFLAVALTDVCLALINSSEFIYVD